jgi:hypothetical protein
MAFHDALLPMLLERQGQLIRIVRLRDTRWTNNFRENLWLAVRTAHLLPSEVRRAQELVELEPDTEIRDVARFVLAQHLPPSERKAVSIELWH